MRPAVLGNSIWLEGARELLPRAVALRRDIHRHPELGLHLPRTTSAIRSALASLDVEIAESRTTSGLMVTLRGGADGPTVLLRADMDALPMPEDTNLEFRSVVPDRMHACGHDAHSAMLAMAVHLLHRNRARIAGTVKFMFQPGEEGFFGARHMIEEGLLDAPPAPQAAFALHVHPNLRSGLISTRSGPILAAMDQIGITVKGQGGHASMPHLARDPVPVACEIVSALQSFVTRRVNAFDPVVLSVTKIAAGSTHNVIPETASLVGTLRSLSPDARELAKAAIERIPRKIAEAHEMRAEVEIEPGYPPTINDPTFTEFATRIAEAVCGTEYRVDLPAPIMGAEDFSYVLQRIPGCIAFLGVAPAGIAPERAHACHSNRMILDENAMIHGIALLAAVAERFTSLELERVQAAIHTRQTAATAT